MYLTRAQITHSRREILCSVASTKPFPATCPLPIMNLSSLKSLREKSTHKSLFGSVDKHGVVADQRSAHRREPGTHG